MKASRLITLTCLLAVPTFASVLERNHPDRRIVTFAGKQASEIYDRLAAEEFHEPVFDTGVKIDDASGITCTKDFSNQVVCSFTLDSDFGVNFSVPYVLTDRGILVTDSPGAEKLYDHLVASESSKSCPPTRGTTFTKGPLVLKMAKTSGLLCLHNTHTNTYQCRLDVPKPDTVVKDAAAACDFDFSRPEP